MLITTSVKWYLIVHVRIEVAKFCAPSLIQFQNISRVLYGLDYQVPRLGPLHGPSQLLIPVFGNAIRWPQ